MTNKYMERYSTSLVIRKIQVKPQCGTTVQPPGIVKIKRTGKILKCWQGCKTTGILIHC